jgi:HAD superfamily hydrolase (TIGR01490 family)
MSGTAQGRGGVAAFFDVDGTLLPGASLELRFFAALRGRRAIPARNYLLWLGHAVRLAPRGIERVALANKMYLRGVRIDRGGQSARGDFDGPAGSRGREVLRFLPDALARMAWHASQKHSIVLVSGTLAPLAHEVALALTLRLAVRGVPASIGVCATRLEERDGRCTGHILGDAMIGEAKAHAIRRLAAEQRFDLAQCYAYGDTSRDRWMLGAVGWPAAVNPSPDLRRVARLHDWPVLFWPARSVAPLRKGTGAPGHRANMRVSQARKRRGRDESSGAAEISAS